MNGHSSMVTASYCGHMIDALQPLHLLSSVQAILAADPNPVASLPQITRLLVPAYADLCALYVLDSKEQLRLAAMHTTPGMADAPLVLARALLAQSTGVLQTRQALLAPDLWMSDDVLADTARNHDIALSSALYVPLYVHEQPIGVLCMLLGSPGAHYDQHDCAIAEQLAAFIALALDNARLRNLHCAKPALAEDRAALTALTQLLDAPAALLGPEPDYRCQWHNPAFARHVRPARQHEDSVVGMALHDLVDAAACAAIQRHVKAPAFGPLVQPARPGAAQHDHHDAWSVWPLRDHDGRPAGLLLIGAHHRSDDNEAHQQKLLVAQKLESLGLFASSIAHDLNNILTVVQGNIELALMDVEPADDNLLEKYLTTVETASQRASDLVRQILAYASTRVDDGRPIQINRLIQEMDDLLDASLSKQISLTYKLAPDLPVIVVNVTQIRQVLLNLMINAVDAIGPNRGHITVRTGIQAASHDRDRSDAANWVFVEIKDDGCGMDEATMATIFEPFFTTKPTGCGLGLAAVQGIIQAHEGRIAVTSQPGSGTTFRIMLPCPQQPGALPAQCATSGAWRGSGTLLVIDDDQAVRHTIRHMVETLGFTVLEAAGGLEGLRLLSARERDIDAALVDVTMPGLNGYELHGLIGKSMPNLPVLLMSGSEPDQHETGAGDAAAPRFLQKPLTFQVLRDTLAALLPARCVIRA